METFSALLAICAGNSLVAVNSPLKDQWRGDLMFSLICIWINGWVNNREAGDLRCYHAHYVVIVMFVWKLKHFERISIEWLSIGSYWCYFIIGLDNGLVSRGNKPLSKAMIFLNASVSLGQEVLNKTHFCLLELIWKPYNFSFLASWNRSLSYRGTSMSVWLSVGVLPCTVDNFEIWYTCSSYSCRKTCAIRFSKFSLFIFSWFYVWKFRVNVSFNIASRRIYSGTLRVETSRCRGISLPGKHANIAKLWDLFPKCASSTHLKSKSTAYIHV